MLQRRARLVPLPMHSGPRRSPLASPGRQRGEGKRSANRHCTRCGRAYSRYGLSCQEESVVSRRGRRGSRGAEEYSAAKPPSSFDWNLEKVGLPAAQTNLLCLCANQTTALLASGRRTGECGLWQRRYWEPGQARALRRHERLAVLVLAPVEKRGGIMGTSARNVARR